MRVGRLPNALEAMREVSAALEEMQAERDPLATHILSLAEAIGATEDTKCGRRHAMVARLSYERRATWDFRAAWAIGNVSWALRPAAPDPREQPIKPIVA